VRASSADVAGLERAERPVTAELRLDPQTNGLITAIGELKRQTAPPGPAPSCAGSTENAAGTGPADEQHAIDGIYRYVVTESALRAAGETDQGVIDENVGVLTYTFDGGHYCWTQKAPKPVRNPHECGTYELSGNRMTLNFPTGPPDLYTWKKTADGDLQLTLISTAPEGLTVVKASVAKPWKRVR
jgi:hypothetical protein